jgi:hypothetical protein
MTAPTLGAHITTTTSRGKPSAEPAFCVSSAPSAYVPIWRARFHPWTNVLCARSVRRLRAQIGSYALERSRGRDRASLPKVTERCESFVARSLSVRDGHFGRQGTEVIDGPDRLLACQRAQLRAASIIRGSRVSLPQVSEFTRPVAGHAWLHPNHLDVLVPCDLQTLGRWIFADSERTAAVRCSAA